MSSDSVRMFDGARGESFLSRSLSQEMVARVLSRDDTVRLAVSYVMNTAESDADAIPLSRAQSKQNQVVIPQQSQSTETEYVTSLAPHIEPHRPPASLDEAYINQLAADTRRAEEAEVARLSNLALAEAAPVTGSLDAPLTYLDDYRPKPDPLEAPVYPAAADAGVVSMNSYRHNQQAAVEQAILSEAATPTGPQGDAQLTEPRAAVDQALDAA